MGVSKFGRLTADMLVRAKDTAPFDIGPPRRRKHEQPALSIVTSIPPREEPSLERMADRTVLPGDDSDLLVPRGVFERVVQAAPMKQRRLTIVLTHEEYETLGILAVKKGFTRHQVLRKLLDGYLEWLAGEYGTKCRCISSRCSADCDQLGPAEAAKRPTDVE